MLLTSPDFNPGARIPDRHTCAGRNVSPAFRWADAPSATREFVLVCTDPGASGGIFHHWAAWGIAPDRDFLRSGFGAETMAPGLRQAMNDFGRPGYGGPCPPRGDPPHAYHFRLSALSEPLGPIGPGAGCSEVIRLARPLELAFAELIGVFSRE
jgi:Raf kinase inhibitor-like YbhB/YbcL family protein